MLRLGLTGGIGSGKSTVSAILRRRGVPVLDADALAHGLLEPGQEAYEEAVREFGPQILRPDRAIDRAKLGAIVFSDEAKRARLNEITHTRIFACTAKWFASLEHPGAPEFAVEDAALIIESGGRDHFDRLVVCWCRPEQQLERLLARGLSREDAQRRMGAQMSIDEKLRLADDVIDCSGSLDETERQVDEFIGKWKQLAGAAKNIS